jgi:uncharacterized protein (TIGR03118 family)
MRMITNTEFHWAGRYFGPAFTSIKSTIAPLLCAAAVCTAQAASDARFPELPPICEKIAAPEGHSLAFEVYAVGVQIYSWSGTNWAFVAPRATLYADEGHHGQVGTHYAGPTWESNSGSKVVEQRVDGCTPDATAIPWLLLRTVSREGSGIFSGVTYVQRLDTVGGIAPATSGDFVGEEREVPYTAKYTFYRGHGHFGETLLVSDLPDVAQLQDPNLVNAWGVSFGGSGPFWVNSAGAGKSLLYSVTNDASGAEIVTKQALEVTVGGNPTGVINNNKGGFNGDVFLFANLDGRISGWRSALGTTAETLATRPGAIYTGLALATNSSGLFLLAANFAEGSLDAYDTNATLVARYFDPNAPAGYVPFNVQVINGTVFVMYATHAGGQGTGLIDQFDPETGAFHRFATGTDAGGQLAQIDSPWGIARAPLTFGDKGGDLLIGNFGNGTIMAFGLDGKFHGLLKGVQDGPIEIEKLWGLTFGNGGRAGSSDTLFFGSGPNAETHGFFGFLKPAE